MRNEWDSAPQIKTRQADSAQTRPDLSDSDRFVRDSHDAAVRVFKFFTFLKTLSFCKLGHECKYVCEGHFIDEQCALMRPVALCGQDSTNNASHLNAKPGPKPH